MKHCTLPGGAAMPVLGLGTWRMGERDAARKAEVAAVRGALDMGYRLIDTAEMYGEGGAETVVGTALADALRAGALRREEIFVVSKVYPHNAGRKALATACERSRRRLGLDAIDLYLLHWRGPTPLHETCSALLELLAKGHIRHWGVSNFDTADMRELQQVQAQLGVAGGAHGCAVNQVYYSLSTRGPETSLLPWLRQHAMALMAYSPIDQGALLAEPALQRIAQQRGISAAQLALAWVLAHEGVVAIPKAVREAHLRENLAAAAIALSAAEGAQLHSAFAPPRGDVPLAML